MAIDGKHETRYVDRVSEEDQRIGKSVATYRGDRSQAEVASAMRNAGWKWAQNTVSAIEAGERPLRLAEARDLAKILGMESLSEMFHQDEYTVLRSWAHKTREAHQELQAASRRFEECQVQLAMAGDLAEAAGIPQTNAVVMPLESWLTMSASEAILRDRNSEGLHPTREQQAWFREQNSQGINRGKWLNTLYTSLSKDWVEEGDHEYSEEA